MALSVANLSLQQALDIVNCDNIDSFYRLFSEEDVDNLLRETLHHPRYKNRRTTFNQCVLALIAQEPTLPSIMLWSIVGSITLAVTSLAIITVVTLALLGLGSLVYGFVTYSELSKSHRESDHYFKLSMLKTHCAEQVIRQYKQRIVTTHDVNLDPLLPRVSEPRPFHYVNDNRSTQIKKSVGMGLLISTTLFGTYYIGTSAVLAAFGLSVAFGVLASPMAIGMGIGVALAIGLYFGIRHYHELKHQDKMQKLQSNLNEDLQERKAVVDELHCMHNMIHLANYSGRRPSPSPSPEPERRRASPPIKIRRSHSMQFFSEPPVSNEEVANVKLGSDRRPK